MKDYYFIYKDAFGAWCSCTNPVFIAMHKYCRAIPKDVIHKLGYELLSDFVYDLNHATDKIIDQSVAEYL